MSEIKRCPFCGIPLKLVGSKRRGNQHYLHEYNNNCILNGFGFTATDENIQHWNNRKPMERIVERLEEQAEECRKYWQEFDDEDSFGAMNAYCNAVKIVKEEGGMNE